MADTNHKKSAPQITHAEPEHRGSRDPQARPVDANDEEELREKALDKTLADSFPTSDPPSSIPNPGEEEDSHAA